MAKWAKHMRLTEPPNYADNINTCNCLITFKDMYAWLGCVDISHLSPVIPSEARNLKSVNGVCATSLDSSLRCAPFRMTRKGRCVQDDRINLLFRSKTLYVSNVNKNLVNRREFQASKPQSNTLHKGRSTCARMRAL